MYSVVYGRPTVHHKESLTLLDHSSGLLLSRYFHDCAERGVKLNSLTHPSRICPIQSGYMFYIYIHAFNKYMLHSLPLFACTKTNDKSSYLFILNELSITKGPIWYRICIVYVLLLYPIEFIIDFKAKHMYTNVCAYVLKKASLLPHSHRLMSSLLPILTDNKPFSAGIAFKQSPRWEY